MTVKELEEFLKNVNDKSKTVYFYHQEDNPFNDGIGTVNVFEVSKDERIQETLRVYTYRDVKGGLTC